MTKNLIDVLGSVEKEFAKSLPSDRGSTRRLRILMALGEGSNPVSVKDLAQRLDLSKPAISRGLDALEQCDFARRQEAAKDKRLVDVRITRSGRKILDMIQASAS